MHSYEKALHIKCLKHNLCNLLSVLRSVHWWLSENEIMVLGFATDIGVNGFMPEFLNTFPVINLRVFKKTSNIMGLLLSCSFFADKEVQIIVL